MDPAIIVLHYGQEIFEGLKAFRTDGGKIQFFRSRDNFKRMNRSCRALCIPEFDPELALVALKQLVAIEREWVPRAPEKFL